MLGLTMLAGVCSVLHIAHVENLNPKQLAYVSPDLAQVWDDAERILLPVQWHSLPGVLPDAGHCWLEEFPLLCQAHLQVQTPSCYLLTCSFGALLNRHWVLELMTS